tara:strand:+ start:181 stop:1023 length:843 start_codon:yes stop_codon:yes gene_type:complete
MTYITGYTNRKGPYITDVKTGYGGTGVNVNIAHDILIWGISLRNTGTTEEKVFDIYDNAFSTDHTSTPDQDFNIFHQCVATGSQAVSKLSGAVEWDLETPILARNGFYAKGDDDIDWVIMYTKLPSGNPYDSNSSPTAGDKIKRASLQPNLVVTKGAGALDGTAGALDVGDGDEDQAIISTVDCEIWGLYVTNTTSNPMMLRLQDVENNGYVTKGSWRVGGDDTPTGQMQKLFKIPLYCKGGIKVLSKNEGGANTSGLNVTLIYRELGSDGRSLDASAKL